MPKKEEAFICWGCKKPHNPSTSNGMAHCPSCQKQREQIRKAKQPPSSLKP
jgi:Zn finger protein HypA/HybF involved in hydrogenase expression